MDTSSAMRPDVESIEGGKADEWKSGGSGGRAAGSWFVKSRQPTWNGRKMLADVEGDSEGFWLLEALRKGWSPGCLADGRAGSSYTIFAAMGYSGCPAQDRVDAVDQLTAGCMSSTTNETYLDALPS